MKKIEKNKKYVLTLKGYSVKRITSASKTLSY